MTVIAFIGWVVNFHSSTYFKSNAQVSNTLGALAIGIAANAHARFGRHVENWSLDLWENNLRFKVVKVRKFFDRRTHGPRPFAPKVERSEYDPAHSTSRPTSSASSMSEYVLSTSVLSTTSLTRPSVSCHTPVRSATVSQPPPCCPRSLSKCPPVSAYQAHSYLVSPPPIKLSGTRPVTPLR
jgi:hypothetical protein